ncbi:hypothetical protein SAMN05444920_12469 [Nonomuraea solani]|uniref:Uncharacterized protein n=1 Tax=Nonomuraea solani TaxID=1144553 RepID=A0A1H6EZL2_9ACTN|nr:hypothetical protein SAMN05444920_12469 [Nonomuraea solani]
MGAGLQCADAGIPRTRAMHPYRPVTCSRAPQLPQNTMPDSNCVLFGARLPLRFGAVFLTRASWVARSHSGSAIRIGRPSEPMTGLLWWIKYPSAASLHKMCLTAFAVHGPPFIGRPYSWRSRSNGQGIPSRVRRAASVAQVIFPVSSARIRCATSWIISAATGSIATWSIFALWARRTYMYPYDGRCLGSPAARARTASSRLRFWIARSSICDPHAFISHSFSWFASLKSHTPT